MVWWSLSTLTLFIIYTHYMYSNFVLFSYSIKKYSLFTSVHFWYQWLTNLFLKISVYINISTVFISLRFFVARFWHFKTILQFKESPIFYLPKPGFWTCNYTYLIMLEFSESKMKILNVGLLGLAFMLAFTAFNVSNWNDFYKIRPRISYITAIWSNI